MKVEDPTRKFSGRPCVLVVDDDPTLRMFVRAVLEGVGFHIEEAADGDEAVIRMAEVSPAVVILDMMLPGTTGIEVLERLGAAKVLMLTGVDDPGAEASAVAAGALAYLTKPFSPKELLDHIESLIAL